MQNRASRSVRVAPALPSLVDVETLARGLGVGTRHVRRLVAERRIPFVKVGKLVRFDLVEIATWLDAHRVETRDRSVEGSGRLR